MRKFKGNMLRQTESGLTVLFPWGVMIKVGWILPEGTLEYAEKVQRQSRRAASPLAILCYFFMFWSVQQYGASLSLIVGLFGVAFLISFATGLYPVLALKKGDRYSKEIHGQLISV